MLLQLCEVFWDCLNKVWRGHENGKGADDGEKWKRHQTETIHDCCSKFPLTADCLSLILVTESLSNVHHFRQDAMDLLFSCKHPHCLPLFFIWRPADSTTAARHARVTAGWAASTVNGVVAKVQVHVTVGGWVGRGRLTGHYPHLNAAGTGMVCRRMVIFGVGFAFLARLLHAQEPGTPVEQDHAHLRRAGRIC